MDKLPPIVSLPVEPTEYTPAQVWIMLQLAERGPLVVLVRPDKA